MVQIAITREGQNGLEGERWKRIVPAIKTSALSVGTAAIT